MSDKITKTIPFEIVEYLKPGLFLRHEVVEGTFDGRPFRVCAVVSNGSLILEYDDRQFVLNMESFCTQLLNEISVFGDRPRKTKVAS
jgi:hypothetical protein